MKLFGKKGFINSILAITAAISIAVLAGLVFTGTAMAATAPSHYQDSLWHWDVGKSQVVKSYDMQESDTGVNFDLFDNLGAPLDIGMDATRLTYAADAATISTVTATASANDNPEVLSAGGELVVTHTQMWGPTIDEAYFVETLYITFGTGLASEHISL